MGGVKIIMAAAALAFVALAAVSFAPQEQAPEPAVALDQADQSMPSFYPGWTSEDKENTMHSLMLEAVAKNISGLTAQGLEKLSNSPCSWGGDALPMCVGYCSRTEAPENNRCYPKGSSSPYEGYSCCKQRGDACQCESSGLPPLVTISEQEVVQLGRYKTTMGWLWMLHESVTTHTIVCSQIILSWGTLVCIFLGAQIEHASHDIQWACKVKVIRT